MGEPSWGHAQLPQAEYIGLLEATGGTETSKYPEEEKPTGIARVAASEIAPAQTRARVSLQGVAARGVVGPAYRDACSARPGYKGMRERNGMGRPAAAGESPVREPPSPRRRAPE